MRDGGASPSRLDELVRWVEGEGRSLSAVERRVAEVLAAGRDDLGAAIMGGGTEREEVLSGTVGSAGVVDIGFGWTLVLAIEGDTFVEAADAERGAAAVVGRSLRQIAAAGGRPVACLDALRGGAAVGGELFDMAVRGLSGHTNRVGIPVVGGLTELLGAGAREVVVQNLALGVARRERALLTTPFVGGPLPLFAAAYRQEVDDLDRTPSGGAVESLAEKCLLEGYLLALRTGDVLRVRSVGSAGVVGAVWAMGSVASAGASLDLGSLAEEAQGLEASELLLAGPEQRLVLAVRRGGQREVARRLERWGVRLTPIGELASGDRLVVLGAGETVVDLPVGLFEPRPSAIGPAGARPATSSEAPTLPEIADPGAELVRLVETPAVASRAWIWEQCDTSVRTNTLRGPGSDAAVLALKGTPIGVAVTMEGSASYARLDPVSAARQALAEAVRNLACVGAEAVACAVDVVIGSDAEACRPGGPRDMVEALDAAARTLGVPVVSARSTCSKASDEPGILIPTVAMAGVVPELVGLPEAWFSRAGDRVVLLGEDRAEFGGSAWLRSLYDTIEGEPPGVDLELEARLAELLLLVVFEGWARTVRDLGEGGLGVALAEASFGLGLGAEVELSGDPRSLFSETQGRALLAVAPENVEAVLEAATETGVPAREIGEVGGDRLEIGLDGANVALGVDDLRRRWREALPRFLGV